jgi:hypothetical protein
MTSVERLLTGKHSHVLNLVVDRFTYLRQFSPALLQHLDFRMEEGVYAPVVEAIHLLQEMNRDNRRKLPEDAPTEFIPRKLRSLVEQNGVVDKHAWECLSHGPVLRFVGEWSHYGFHSLKAAELLHR